MTRDLIFVFLITVVLGMGLILVIRGFMVRSIMDIAVGIAALFAGWSVLFLFLKAKKGVRKMKIKEMILIMIVVMIPLTFADIPDSEFECGTNCHSSGTIDDGNVTVSYRALCISTGGKWIPDMMGHSINDGTCNCIDKVWDTSVGCKVRVQETSGSNEHSITYDKICNLDKRSSCSLKLDRLKPTTMIKDKKEYKVIYWGLNGKNPIVKITLKNRWVFLNKFIDGKLIFGHHINPKINVDVTKSNKNNLFVKLNRG